MGNGIGKLSTCFSGDSGQVSRPGNDVVLFPSDSDPLDEGLGHSFCYIPPDQPAQSPDEPTPAAAFRAISGASISANVSTPLSTNAYNTAVDKASAFESSDFFSSIPLQPIPRSTSVSTAIKSGPILRNPAPGSGPIERGFLSGPIERSFISGPLEIAAAHPDHTQRYEPAKSKKWALVKNLKRIIPKSIWAGPRINGLGPNTNNTTAASSSNSGNSSTITSHNLSSDMSLIDEEEVGEESFGSSRNVQWAQGKAGEDRVHVVVSEDHGWVFVGIYDGFNGPDATDFLSNNLYSNVHKELKGLLWSDTDSDDNNIDIAATVNIQLGVLKAMCEALRKTEASYLEIADMMLVENPELALMGSCVLVMVMKDDDVYLMNVGDSRAVLARRKGETDLLREESKSLYGYEYDNVNHLSSSQLTMDHSTSVKEEVRRIRNAHLDDPCAILNDRVKGSLKVTRAFGAGYLKQPKWNDALLEMFRIDYVGSSPYVTCSPSLCHHKIESRDKFLILSSDGLYQYFTNDEAVSEVEAFISTFPEGDPAQHLVEEVLFRAAKKAGMDFHELLDIPQGDRRRYHDDVSIIIISFEGRIWRSSV